jgi:hypothetical protein
MVFLDSIRQFEPLRVVRKVKSLYSKTANQGLFGSVMLLWGITTVQKLGNHLKRGMVKILQKVLRVPLIGLIKFFGLVLVGVRKIHQSLNDMLKAVSPKGNVYKAIKGTEFVNIVEDNRNK